MKTRTQLTLVSSLLLTPVLFVVAQQFLSGPAGTEPQSLSQTEKESSAEGPRPWLVDPETGMLHNEKGEVVDDPKLNSQEQKDARVLSAWALVNPKEYWKLADPDRANKPQPQFEIQTAEQYQAALLLRETPREREMRELATLAITDPVTYRAELARRGLEKSQSDETTSEKLQTESR